jgi:hypothetical protein
VSTQAGWYQACAAAIAQLGGQMCADPECNNSTVGPMLWNYCTCQAPWVNGCSGPNPPAGCCFATAATPVMIAAQNCYCCCGWAIPSAAADAETQRPLKDYVAGDPVYVAIDITAGAWETRPVAWSGGVASGGETVRVSFAGPDGNGELIVDRGHLFLTPGGDLKAAAELVAGHDQLVGSDGGARELLAVQPGPAGQELHQLATSTTPATTRDGHLLLTDGVVSADWALQVGLSTTASERPR